jgi:hypothetical protein
MVLYVGQVEVKEAVTYKVKVMRSHGETLQFAFSDKDNMSEIEREDTVVKTPGPISSCGAAHTTTLEYCSVNFLKKELQVCRQKKCASMDIQFIYIHLFLIILCSQVPHGC